MPLESIHGSPIIAQSMKANEANNRIIDFIIEFIILFLENSKKIIIIILKNLFNHFYTNKTFALIHKKSFLWTLISILYNFQIIIIFMAQSHKPIDSVIKIFFFRDKF